MPKITAEWKVVKSTTMLNTLIASPTDDRTIARYVLWNSQTKIGSFKEKGQPLILLGEFDSINDVIKKVMKS